MKGVIFNLLESTIVEDLGEDAWDDVLEECGLGGAYTSLGNYPDEELLALLSASARREGRGEDEALRWFGREALARLAQTYGSFFEGHRSAQTFVLTLNEVIHPEVRKIYPGASVPDFDFDVRGDGELVLTYRSAKRLCRFAEGLVEGAALRYGERVDIEQPVCMLSGDDRCEIVCRFSPAAEGGASHG